MFNGHQPTLILNALFNEDLCALEIVDKVSRTTGFRLSVSGIYSQLQRLVNAGLLDAEYEAEAPDGGRPRRIYAITVDGISVLNQHDLAREGALNG